MSRISTFVAIGLVIIVAVYMRRFAIDIIGPGTPLWELAAASSIGSTGGEEWAEDVYIAATVYVPWLLVGAALLGGLYREFVAANVTQVRR